MPKKLAGMSGNLGLADMSEPRDECNTSRAAVRHLSFNPTPKPNNAN